MRLITGGGDVAGEAARLRQGLEETARQMRYAFLQTAAQEVGANLIATAHNASDNAETVLLHLGRGSGLRGLAGDAPQAGQSHPSPAHHLPGGDRELPALPRPPLA